jgi:hypothetical protein
MKVTGLGENPHIEDASYTGDWRDWGRTTIGV